MITGALGCLASLAASVSEGGRPSVASVRYTMTSASSSARTAVLRIASCSGYFGSSSPGVSRITICASALVRIPTMRSRVDWGFGLVIESFWPTMRFRSVDLPTLGFPTTVTIPERGISEVSL
jgi:hypothetical protein